MKTILNLWGIEKLYVLRSDIPAVTHVDYSSRLQTVTQISNPTTTYYAPVVKITSCTGKYIRLNPTVGGSSSPSMTVTATVVLKG